MSRYRERTQHGLSPALKGRAGLPLTGPAADALALWRAELVADLGDDLSAQRSTLVELACRQRWLLDQVDSWLLGQASIVNKRKREILPIVRSRQTIADGLARLLGQLGLDRVAEERGGLEAYLAAKVRTARE